MKKADIELQFNWIFVLIVGTVILAFFIGVVMKQKGFAEQKTGVQLSADLETITTGAEVSKGTAQIIKVPQLGIEFRSEDCLRRYSIGGGTKQYREKIIFAPGLIKGNEILAWTMDWNVPYRVTNFLFLTSPQMRYILIDLSGANELAFQVNKSLPNEMYRELVTNPNSIINNRNYKVRLAYFSALPSQIVVPDELQSVNDKDLTAVNIVSSTPYKTGTLTFYEKKGSSFQPVGQTYILGILSIYGAIFTDDYEMYNCNMKEAFKKMNFVTTIIQNRTNVLYNDVAICMDEYYLSFMPLQTIAAESSILMSIFPVSSQARVDSLYNAAFVELESSNRNLQLQSCPELY
jgi:hypothetical protein